MIRRHFGITYHVEHVRTILRHRLRWSSQKPQKKAKQRNTEKEEFPGYAPDANPDEGVWGWTKYHRLPNFAPEDLGELRARLHTELSSLSKRGDLLASFIRHAKIPLRL